MPVQDLATTDVVTTERDASLESVAQTMESEGVGSAIVTEGEQPVGIVTDRDIALAVGRGDDLGSQTADDVIDGNLQTIQGDVEGYAAAKKLGEARVRRLPVVDDGGSLQGVVTLDDMVATIGEELDQVAAVIEEQSPDYRPT